MEQPPGFIKSRFLNHVCYLKKALCGVKKDPRDWFQSLRSFLINIGFTCSQADTSLFILKQNSNILYFLVYVDEIILTSNNVTHIKNIITHLNKYFLITDLRKLNYFLGFEASYHYYGIFLCQAKYANNIHTKAHLFDDKPAATPIFTLTYFTTQATLFIDPPFIDPWWEPFNILPLLDLICLRLLIN